MVFYVYIGERRTTESTSIKLYIRARLLLTYLEYMT